MKRWNGARFALLTQHGKERLLQPLFFERFAANLQLATGFDTDTLGTFTGEVPRRETQLATARRKAALAIELTGLPFGVGSEGSSVPGPLGFGTVGLEVVTLVDVTGGIEITGRASGPAQHDHGVVRRWEELEERARAALFPSHALCLGEKPRTPTGVSKHLAKGLTSWEALRTAFVEVQGRSPDGTVFFETELRAHLNPTRQALISAATRDLVERMATPCPSCGTPGFGISRRVAGLPCRDCGAPTNQHAADVRSCVSCRHTEQLPVESKVADPRWCPTCNP